MGLPEPSRTPERPGKAKRRILDAAARLFRNRGFARSTVRELADAVGIQSGSLFHHFRSKDEILFAVMEEVIVEMDAALAESLARAPTVRDKVRALVHNQLCFIHGPRGDASAVLLYEWTALSAEGQERLLRRRDAFFSRWHDVLCLAKAEGLIQIDPTVLRQLIHGATIWTARWYKDQGGLSLSDLEDSILTLVFQNASSGERGAGAND